MRSPLGKSPAARRLTKTAGVLKVKAATAFQFATDLVEYNPCTVERFRLCCAYQARRDLPLWKPLCDERQLVKEA